MIKNITLLFILSIFFNTSQVLANCQCNTIASGEWSNPSTWNCVDIAPGSCTSVSGIPEAGDIITIEGQHDVHIAYTVDLSTQGDNTPTSIVIHGSLLFVPPVFNCGGGECDIDLILDTDSEINVTSVNGIMNDSQGAPLREIVIGGEIVLDHPNGFPFGPGMLPEFALPVDLTSFSGYAMERSNVIKWQTASEENTMVFLVERSLDGRRDFKEIIRVDAYGNSTSVRNYDIEDENPVSLAYYRLRIVDFDGTFEYSDVIAIERTKTAIDLVEVYPVPAEEEVTVLVHAKAAGKAIVTLSDFMGRKIKEDRVELKAGINHYTYEFGDHETNFYYLTIYNGNERIAKKILRASRD